MNSKSHVNSHAMKGVYQLIEQMPPLKEYKSPALGAVAGAFGAIGIGLYFQSMRDFLWSFGLCLAIVILAIPTGESLAILAPVFCAIYGYRRAVSSNLRLAARWGKGQVIDVEEVPLRPPPIPGHVATTFVSTTAETRLQKLDDLLAKKFISKVEYNQKRQQILTEL